MEQTKQETVLDVKWTALNQPADKNKSCSEAAFFPNTSCVWASSLWTLRHYCCSQMEAPHFPLSPDLKSNGKVTRRGAKPCSALAVHITVVLPEYTGMTLQEFCWCGNKIFALCKIWFQLVFIFNCFKTPIISTCVHMGWTTQHLWLCMSRLGQKHSKQTVMHTQSVRKCCVGPILCRFMQVWVQLVQPRHRLQLYDQKSMTTLALLLIVSHKSKGKTV